MNSPKENIVNVKAMDIKVGDLIGVSICNYFGWETVEEVTPQQNGSIKISTGPDYTLYSPDRHLQVKLPDSDEISHPRA